MATVKMGEAAQVEKLPTAADRARALMSPSGVEAVDRERLRELFGDLERAEAQADARKIARTVRAILIFQGLGPKIMGK